MRFTILILLAFLLNSTSFAQGIEFFHGDLEEALVKAEEEGKLIFVDCYTTWCGPCKRMAKTAFKDDAVGEFYNDNFINLKIDMEKNEGLKFQRKYPVAAFPTLYYLDHKGEVVHKVKGAQQAEQLIKLGTFAGGKVDYSADYAKLYEEGDRDPELVYNYVKALNKSGKSSLKISNDYINSQKDMNTDFNLRFILEAASEADSRIFKMLIKNRTKIATLESEQAVNDKIEKACKLTAAKAIEYESADLKNEAIEKMKKNYPANAASFASQANLDFYKAMGDSKNYLKCCNNYAKKEIWNDAKKLHAIAKDIQKTFATNSDAMKTAEKIAKQAATTGNDPKIYFTYADILYNNGKKSDALKAAKKSLNLVGDDKMAQHRIQQFIDKIEQG